MGKKKNSNCTSFKTRARDCSWRRTFSNLDPLLSKNILNLFINQKNYLRIKIPETILISLHQINLINNFNRVIGLKDGEIVIDREIHNINQSELDWLF